MRKNWKMLLLCVAVPLLVGGISGLLTQGGMEAFETLNKPALAPPGWLFPVVWTILYILMGVASYLVIKSNASREIKGEAIFIYGIQLVVNFFWSIIFFNLEQYLFAFIWLLFLWILSAITIYRFYKADKRAAYLLIPYFLWVTFAGYLNLSIYLLN